MAHAEVPPRQPTLIKIISERDLPEFRRGHRAARACDFVEEPGSESCSIRIVADKLY